MSDIPETPSTNPKTCTNEISIQVEIDPINDYFPKPGLRYSVKYPNRNIEIDPSYSQKTVKLKKPPSVIIQSFRRNSLASENSFHEDFSSKRIGLEISLKKKIANQELSLQKRSQSNDLMTQQQIRNRLKLLAGNNLKSKETKSKLKNSEAKLVKSPSSYQIPPVYDPLCNFSSKVQSNHTKIAEIKPKVFKKYQFGAFKKISSHNLSSAQSRFENLNQLKKKYFFRKHSNLIGQS